MKIKQAWAKSETGAPTLWDRILWDKWHARIHPRYVTNSPTN